MFIFVIYLLFNNNNNIYLYIIIYIFIFIIFIFTLAQAMVPPLAKIIPYVPALAKWFLISVPGKNCPSCPGQIKGQTSDLAPCKISDPVCSIATGSS